GAQARSPSAYSRIVDKAHAASVYSSYGLLISFADEVGFIIGYDNTFKIIWDSVALTDGQWAHVAGTYDGSWMRLYVNGVLRTSFELNQPINYDAYDLTIGKYEGPYVGGAFKGDIDEVCIFNEALVPKPVADANGPYGPSAKGSPVSFDGSASYDSDGTIASYEWNFGDGSFGSEATPSHTYGEAGIYDVTLTVKDNDGLMDSDITYVVVYDPSAGFVTGGGWIDSPAGAYMANTALTGKANFGFVSKYQKGATVPTGQTEFKFEVADMEFHSTSYEWLVAAGSSTRAQYKGSGTINDTGDYGFLLTAIDGQYNGGTGLDRFRIKIWDKATGDIVYDNQMKALDTDDPTTAIVGGSIVIHTGKK
ncbi:MAG: PKD domain-containing protein, partial [Candidatus Bathyarchaeota archaeon]